MVDIWDAKKRSLVMGAVRGFGNKSTELRLIAILRQQRITGWRRKATLPGRPDLVFPGAKLAIFTDGCFWHGCPRCYRAPQTRRVFWRNKLIDNLRRDRRVTRQLQKMGWRVLRVWECSLRKHPGLVSTRVRTCLKKLEKTRAG
jgi:DNA mismatch endonuclease (patch repair protein)